MLPKWWNRSGTKPVLVALLLLATGAGAGRGGAPQGKTDPPIPLPEKIVTAWKEAGAKVRLAAGIPGWLQWVYAGASRQARRCAGVSLQRMASGTPGKVARPGGGFRAGPWLHRGDGCGAEGTGRTQELTHTLNLGFTQIMDEGLTELAGRETSGSLHTLDCLTSRG